MMKNIKKSSIAVLISMLMVPYANAHEGGYVSDASGKAVVDGSGDCVKADLGNILDGCIPVAAPIKPPPVVVAPPRPVVKAPVYVAPPKPVIKRAPPKPIVKLLTLNETGGSNFAFDSDKLSDKAKRELSNFVQGVKSSNVNPDRITIVGHTDSIGSDQYNQGLSNRRANSVASFLTNKGMNRNIMSISGRGESQPVASNSTKSGRAQNRRVDISVSGQKKVIIRR